MIEVLINTDKLINWLTINTLTHFMYSTSLLLPKVRLGTTHLHLPK